MTTDQTSRSKPTVDDLRDIQGNLIGFNKDHQRLVFLSFPAGDAGRSFLADLLPLITNGWEVKQFNTLFKEIRGARQGPEGIIQATWTNVWLSAEGLRLLAAEDVDDLPTEFLAGMASRAAAIGDVDASAPERWLAPFQPGGPQVHAIAVIGSDAPDDRDSGYRRLLEIASARGVIEVAPPQDGDVRMGPNRGHEHFGFKDGISQPGIAGLTTSSKGGRPIAAGEFLLGYPDEDGNISGQPTATPPPPPSTYDPTPPPPLPHPLPTWTHNASFVVYRRLRQDVAAFRDAMQQQSATLGENPDQLGAKLVGRWASGAPLAHVAGEGQHQDTTTADPSIADPNVLDDTHINNFTFDSDADGHVTPRPAHIRKTNPRSDQLPEGDKSNRHRMLRRGSPYGPEFQPGENAYGDVVPDTQDRGLLFICYQSSITRSFEFVQTRWAKAPDFPQQADGRDAIISQDTPQRAFHLPNPDTTLTFAPWVFTTGGGYYISLSLTGLRTLSGSSGS